MDLRLVQDKSDWVQNYYIESGDFGLSQLADRRYAVTGRLSNYTKCANMRMGGDNAKRGSAAHKELICKFVLGKNHFKISLLRNLLDRQGYFSLSLSLSSFLSQFIKLGFAAKTELRLPNELLWEFLVAAVWCAC